MDQQEGRSSDKGWQEFERLVARIEATLAPEGAIIKSPDHIPDLLTGSLREVDASIRYSIGTIPLLITIECRDRGNVQDDTWIEQLATKKEKIGAARTIAVSAEGFTGPAHITAAAKGIELRRLEEVTIEEIQRWMIPTAISNNIHKSILQTFDAKLYSELGDPDFVQLSLQVVNAFNRDIVNARVFTRSSDGAVLNINNIWRMITLEHPHVYDGIPEDGTSVRSNIAIEIPRGQLSVDTEHGPRFVKSLLLGFDLYIEVHEMLPSTGSFFLYSNREGLTIQRAEFSGEIEGSHLNFSFQNTPDARDILVTISQDLRLSPHVHSSEDRCYE